MNYTGKNIDLDRLKRSIQITDLARDLGLAIRGRQARCYNSSAHKHGDRNFSLGLNTKTNRYKCFACGEQGSIIDLYKQVRGVELSQAIKELAEMTGLTPISHQTHHRAEIAQAGQETHHSTIYKPFEPSEPASEPLGAYSDIYEELLKACEGLDTESRDYLTGATRGLTDETISKFLLFSINDYPKINKHLKERFSEDELQKAGLLSDEGNLIFYKHKIIIPFTQDGRVIYLRGRYLENGNAHTDGAKMLGLKGQTTKRLFNAEILADLKKGDKIYICEGEFDAMILDQNNFNAVAILGTTNFNADDIDLFKGLDVVLCLDNDEAGQRATQEVAKMFLLKGQAVKTKQLPENIKDITEYFTK